MRRWSISTATKFRTGREFPSRLTIASSTARFCSAGIDGVAQTSRSCLFAGHQFGQSLRFLQGLGGVEMAVKNHIGESASVGVDDRGHYFLPFGTSPLAAICCAKSAHQRLIGGGVHLNLFSGERDRKIGGVGRQFPPRRLCRGRNLLLRRCDDLTGIFRRCSFDSFFLGGRFPFGGGAHFSDFRVQPGKPGLNIAQPPVGLFAGFARFCHRFLD